MSGQPLFARPGATFHLTPTPEARLHVIRMDVTTTRMSDAIEDLSVFFATFCRDFEDVSSSTCATSRRTASTRPGCRRSSRSSASSSRRARSSTPRRRGRAGEGNRIDDFVLGANNLFLSIYQPKRAFDIVDTPRGASDFVDALVTRERAKRERRN